jgi:hypothetical protein
MTRPLPHDYRVKFGRSFSYLRHGGMPAAPHVFCREGSGVHSRAKDSGLRRKMEHPNAASRHLDGGFYAIDFFFSHSFARSFVIGRPGSAAFRNEGRNDRSSSAASWSAVQFRALINDSGCTSRFHASGKQPGAQRLHRGICARRYSANPILHRSIAEGGQWSRPGRSGPRRLHKKSESDPMQHSR